MGQIPGRRITLGSKVWVTKKPLRKEAEQNQKSSLKEWDSQNRLTEERKNFRRVKKQKGKGVQKKQPKTTFDSSRRTNQSINNGEFDPGSG